MEMCIYQIKKHFSINVYSGLSIKKGIVIKKKHWTLKVVAITSSKFHLKISYISRGKCRKKCVWIKPGSFHFRFDLKFKLFALTSKNISDILNDSIKWNSSKWHAVLTGRKPLHPLFTQEAWTALTSIKTVNKRAYNNGNPLYQTLLDEWHCTRSQSETQSTEVSHIFKDKTFKEYAYIFLCAHKTPRKPLPKYSLSLWQSLIYTNIL